MTYVILLTLIAYALGALAPLTTPLVLGGVVLCFWFLREKPIAVMLLIAATIVGYALSYLSYTELLRQETALFHQPTPQEGMVVRIDKRALNSRVTIDLEDARVLARVAEIGDVKRGDVVFLTGEFTRVEDFISDEGYLVPYRTHLLSQGVVAVVNNAEVIRTRARDTSFIALAAYTQEQVSQLVHEALPEPESSLLLGLVIGDAAGLGEKGDEYMRRAGLTHILVLSGFNVTVVGLFLVTIFSFASIPLRALAAICGIILLVAASGGDPPAVRAGITGTLALCALVFGRERSVFHLLLVTLLGMLLFNPLLITNISFQLSALATIGVITLTEPIQKLLPKLPFAEILASTLAALLSVLPLSIVSFHSVSLIAPVANLLVLPLVPVSMLLGVIGVLSTLVVGSIGSMIAYVPLHIVYVLGTWFGSLPFASIEVSLSPLLLLVYVPLVFVLVRYVEKKNTAM